MSNCSSFVLRCGEQLLELPLIILVQCFKVVDLILVGFLLSLRIIFILLYDINDFLFEAGDFTLEFLASLSQLGDISLHLILLLLGHQCFPHSVSYG